MSVMSWDLLEINLHNLFLSPEYQYKWATWKKHVASESLIPFEAYISKSLESCCGHFNSTHFQKLLILEFIVAVAGSAKINWGNMKYCKIFYILKYWWHFALMMMLKLSWITLWFLFPFYNLDKNLSGESEKIYYFLISSCESGRGEKSEHDSNY